jgi:very-short-patch-repair endonuclease
MKLRAPKDIIELARELRKEQTPAEKLLWERLRNRKLEGLKFDRQFPIVIPVYNHKSNIFIADFYCHEKKLVLELDGGIHLMKIVSDHDEGRTHYLNQAGIKVLRFRNEEVLNNIESVIKKILAM